MSDDKVAMIKPDIALDVMDKDIFPHNPFSESFDAEFWQAVSDLYQDGTGEKSWAAAVSEVRVQRLTNRFEESGKNVIIGLMEDVYDKFYRQAVNTNQLELMPSFIQQLSEITNVIINNDYEIAQRTGKKSTYSRSLKCTDGSKMTVLHLVSERNLANIGQHIVNLYPGQCYIKSSGAVGKRIALELALEDKMDDSASMLIKAMLNERVRQLFEFDDAIGRSKFSFSKMASDETMKQTVMAVLDCLINPDFPYVPVPPGEQSEVAWSKIPDMPMRYHIYYRLLDGDEHGRPARIKNLDTGNYVENEQFDHMSPSGLYLIANSPFNDDIIGHPAVRILIRRKWNDYGARRIRLYGLLYVIYLAVMSLAFFLPTETNDRTVYSSKTDKIRAFFELFTVFMSVTYLMSEIDQMFKEKLQYWKDPFNYLDLFGLLCILLLVPIKWGTVDYFINNPSMMEMSIAAIAYPINFLRVLKYFPAYKQIGVYAKTFAEIFYKDISKFFVLYAVCMGAFTGTVILAISATADGFAKAKMTKLEVFLQEIRALTEGAGFADSYIGIFRTSVIFLLMINMFIVIVMLTNILIGQLSYRYEIALANAHIQYDIDKTKIVTKLENSRFRSANFRIKYYEDAAYMNETDVIHELLDDWNQIGIKSRKKTGEKSAKDLMKKMFTQLQQGP